MTKGVERAPKIETEKKQEPKIVGEQSVALGKEEKETLTKKTLEDAVSAINDFLEVDHKSSKFVLHDGLNKYYVRLVDAETEEVIKEIPPERLLDAFYEMQKLAGMIVDEKI